MPENRPQLSVDLAVGRSRRTALRELEALVQHGILQLKGKGRGAHYVLVRKRAGNAPIAPSPAMPGTPDKCAECAKCARSKWLKQRMSSDLAAPKTAQEPADFAA